jgi:hypothetical protein
LTQSVFSPTIVIGRVCAYEPGVGRIHHERSCRHCRRGLLAGSARRWLRPLCHRRARRRDARAYATTGDCCAQWPTPYGYGDGRSHSFSNRGSNRGSNRFTHFSARRGHRDSHYRAQRHCYRCAADGIANSHFDPGAIADHGYAETGPLYQ